MIRRPRSLRRLREFHRTFPVVAILGMRQVGKATLARALAGRTLPPGNHFDLEDPRSVARLADPTLELEPLRGLVAIVAGLASASTRVARANPVRPEGGGPVDGLWQRWVAIIGLGIMSGGPSPARARRPRRHVASTCVARRFAPPNARRTTSPPGSGRLPDSL